MSSRPRFFSSFLRAAGDTIERRGLHAITPIWLLATLAIGGVAAWYMPESFWQAKNLGVATTVYTGLLAFDGLLLALGWAAFSKIYEILSVGWFSAFLRRNDLLTDHLLYIDLVHGSLVLSAFTSGCGLITVLLDLSLRIDRIILALSVGLSLYALIKALSAIGMMNDMIWERAHNEPDEKDHIRPVPTTKENGA